MSTRPFLALACALLIGCAGDPAPEAPAPRHDDVVAVLLASADAWNRGDFAGFLEPYENSGRTTYAGSRGFVQGFVRLRESYSSGYWSSGAPADSLSFEVVEVRPLGAEAALLLGRYVLTSRASGERTSHGIFSLVYVITDRGWKITHDHSAETPAGS